MNGTMSREAEVTQYLARVREALADLPEGELDELTEDLSAHFTDIAAETDEPLIVRLGPPEEYAAELRRSAGLTAATAPTAPPALARLRSKAIALNAHLERYPGWVTFRAFLPELRPGWWVLRGVAAAYVLLKIAGVDSVLLFVLLSAALIWISVKLGRGTSPPPGRLRWAAYGVNTLLGFAALALVLGGAYGSPDVQPAYYEQSRDLTNLNLYDSQGRRLTGVQVFDQWGKPVDLPGYYGDPQWTNGHGPVTNVYPRPASPNDGSGEWPPDPSVPPITAVPSPGPSGSQQPDGTGTPTPVPSGTPPPTATPASPGPAPSATPSAR
jgi:hypothetical protein